ncbi:hypothetical protein OROHE_021750 [Orobanche hederae]
MKGTEADVKGTEADLSVDMKGTESDPDLTEADPEFTDQHIPDVECSNKRKAREGEEEEEEESDEEEEEESDEEEEEEIPECDSDWDEGSRNRDREYIEPTDEELFEDFYLEGPDGEAKKKKLIEDIFPTLRIYLRQLYTSGGYDINVFPGYFMGLTPIAPVEFHRKMNDGFAESTEVYQNLAELAAKAFNKKNHGTAYEDVKFVKVNLSPSNYVIYYLTFTASNTTSGTRETFQTKISRCFVPERKPKMLDSLQRRARAPPRARWRLPFRQRYICWKKSFFHLHNMIVQDEGDFVTNWTPEEGSSSSEEGTSHGAPPIFREYLRRKTFEIKEQSKKYGLVSANHN